MKHIIMGTAGHIDHGKTALVRALSGIECDTHVQEKQRGITINLGFAHLHLSPEETISIIDVPGHKDFIHTMVSGSCGIDFVLMVIAADSGIMPQTKEHLQILEMLNIKKGIIALTKIDTIDSDIIELAHEEVTEFTAGTILEKAPVIPVSSVTGEGIEELKKIITRMTTNLSQRPPGEIFRLFIDRIFTVSGFGTVVTGSVISGGLKTGDNVYLLPTGKKLRVRKIEQHETEVQEVIAGDRAAINLVGLSREDFKRGMTLSDRLLSGTVLIDARITIFEQASRLSLWSDAIFLLGTYEMQVKIHLLNRNEAVKSDTVLVQIHLPYVCNIAVNDRFIIRSTSQDVTLGGGEVIDAAPLHHRRRPEELIEKLSHIAHGKLTELITHEVRKQKRMIRHIDLVERLNITADQIRKAINESRAADITIYRHKGIMYLVTTNECLAHKEKIIDNILIFHKNNPMVPEGRSINELLGIIDLDKVEGGSEYIRLLLDELVKEKKLKPVGNTWVSVQHKVIISKPMEELIQLIDTFFLGYQMRVAPGSEIQDYLRKQQISNRDYQQVLKYLVNNNRLYPIEGDYIHADIADRTRDKVLKVLVEKKEGLTVAEFRDLVSDNRKICLRLFALYDKQGYTFRKGDVRVITELGKKLVT